jgi:hypothetical protein
VKDLGRQAGKQNMALFLWLAGEFDRPRDLLQNWPASFDHVDYAWQRSKGQQDKAAKDGHSIHEYARLNHMLLRRLFDVEIDRK